MIEIGGLQVVESYTSYLVEVDGAVIECDDRSEVERICRNDSSVRPLKQRIYVMELEDLDLE